MFVSLFALPALANGELRLQENAVPWSTVHLRGQRLQLQLQWALQASTLITG